MNLLAFADGICHSAPITHGERKQAYGIPLVSLAVTIFTKSLGEVRAWRVILSLRSLFDEKSRR